MTARTTRAAVYLRLSRSHEGSTSIASQREDCYSLCRSRGWAVVAEEVDKDTSGSRPIGERPGLRRLLADLRGFDVLVVAQADRASRSVAVALGLLARLDATDTSLVTARDQLEATTPAGRLSFLSAVATAEAESGLIQARITRSRVALRDVPRWIGGNAPYGYRIVPDGTGGKRLAVHEETAGRIRGIVDRVISGEAIATVCRDLNSALVPSPGAVSSRTGRTTPWSPTVLRRMLKSPALLGHRVTGNGHDRRAVVDALGRPVPVGPPLIPRGTWDRLQAALSSRSATPQRSRRPASLLLHIAHCSECAAPLHYNTRRLLHGGGTNDVYRCPNACKVLISATRLEETIQGWALAEFGALPFIAEIPLDVQPSAYVDQVRSEIEELSRRLTGMRGPAADAVQGQLESRSALLERIRSAPDDRRQRAPTGTSVREEWESRGTGGRRQILLDLGVHVAVRPAHGERRWDPGRLHVTASR